MANVDWSVLTEPSQALSWWCKVEDDYDAYQKNNQFIARVLSPGEEVSSVEMLAAFGMVLPSKDMTIHKFRGRIVGKNSPHSFLPDPCNPAFKDADDEILKNIISLHTMFYISMDSGAKPKQNDYFKVDLNAGGDQNTPFNLQIGRATKRIAAAKDAGSPDADCDALADLDFGDSDSVGSVARTSAKPGTWTASEAVQAITFGDKNACATDEFIMMHPLNVEQDPVAAAANFGVTDELHVNPHGGVDMGSNVYDGANPYGKSMYAVADGTITGTSADGYVCEDWEEEALLRHRQWKPRRGGTATSTCKMDGWDGANGNYVKMEFDHPDAKDLIAFYLHMADAPLVQTGDKVRMGDVIGFIGNTGASHGAHLHWELQLWNGQLPKHLNSSPINPMQYIKTAGPCKYKTPEERAAQAAAKEAYEARIAALEERKEEEKPESNWWGD